MNVRTTGRDPTHGHRWHPIVRHSEMRVALVVAACLLLEAIIAKNVLDVRLDAFTQLGALWVWLAYTLGGRRDRAAELTAMAAAVVATAVILIVYAF